MSFPRRGGAIGIGGRVLFKWCRWWTDPPIYTTTPPYRLHCAVFGFFWRIHKGTEILKADDELFWLQNCAKFWKNSRRYKSRGGRI